MVVMSMAKVWANELLKKKFENNIEKIATAVEIYAGNFFKVIETKPNTNFFDVSNGHFHEISDYKHLKRNKYLAAPLLKRNELK